MTTSIYVEFAGENDDHEQTGSYIARAFVATVNCPALRLPNPLPASCHVQMCTMSQQNACSADVLIQSDEPLDLVAICKHVEKVYRSPSRILNKDGARVDCEQRTHVKVGQFEKAAEVAA